MEHNNKVADDVVGAGEEEVELGLPTGPIGCIKALISVLGYDPYNQHFENTPMRYLKWLQEFAPDPRPFEDVVKVAFRTDFEEMVAVTNIRFTGLCAHHLLPFRGKASVAYVPGASGRIVGLSKLARAVEYFAHRITVQEDITEDLANALVEHLEPKGVMVVIQAEHECMAIRGVKQPGAITITSGVRGCFLDNLKGSKDEFLALAKMDGVH